MKLVKTSALVPGMVIVKDLLQPSGILMLNEGTILTGELINKLQYWGLSEVEVEEPSPSLIEQQETVLIPKITAAHNSVVNMAESIMSSTEFKEDTPFILRGMVGDIESQIDLNSNVLLNLTHLKTHDHYLFSHVVNVSVLAMIIGRELHLGPAEIKELGLSALLHDYGMVQIDRSKYDKNQTMTPEEWVEMRQHPEYGFAYLASSGEFSDRILAGLREHHERIDGSGYPRGLKEQEIHLFGKIIAVADVYDACISPRKHRKRFTPYEALKNLLGVAHLFDIKVLKAFVASMAIYPIGSFVRLNTGEVAKVIGVNQGAPFRPEIRIFFDRNAQKLEKPIRLNLADKEYTQTYIQSTLERDESEEIYQKLGE